MRPRGLKPSHATFVVIVIMACAAYCRVMMMPAAGAVSEQLRSTYIDFSCESMSPDEALDLLHQRLSEKNPFFHTCQIQPEFSNSSHLVSLDLKNCPGNECLKYLTELSSLEYEVKSGRIAVFSIFADRRDTLERAMDSLAASWKHLRVSITGEPVSPLDPFAAP